MTIQSPTNWTDEQLRNLLPLMNSIEHTGHTRAIGGDDQRTNRRTVIRDDLG